MKPIELAAISIKNRLEAEKIEVPFDYEPEAPKTYEEAERLRAQLARLVDGMI
jgi:hypothetical protein